MQIAKYTYTILITALTIALAACSADNDTAEQDGGMATVTLRIGTAGAATTRATDGNANDDELMNVWTVVMTDGRGIPLKMLACKPTSEYREINPIEPITLTAGTYNFYSFANISPTKVAELLGITITEPTLPDDGTITEVTASGTVDAATVANKTVTVNGNDFNPNAADNGFGSQGIPMSNKQSFFLTGEMTKDLIVVRMLAKMKIDITNNTGRDMTVNSATLSRVTGNSADNLRLLPRYTYDGNTNSMEPIHGDIQPNLSDTHTTVDYDLLKDEGPLTIAKDATKTFEFYINESATPADGHFTLALQLDDAEYRYSIINDDNENTGDAGKWNYIARNDYRIIPIVLDEYKLELVPYDFPAIGVLPVSVKEIDTEKHIYQMNFHDYGHFHLVPKVTKSDGTPVPFNTDDTGTTRWSLIDNDWSKSWFTYDNFNGNATDGKSFYAEETPPSTVDGSENGGIPVMDVTTTWNGSTPFIFGYIAEPKADETLPKTIYHEFKTRLYVNKGSVNYSRDMVYRFQMMLSYEIGK